jgi:flagellar biosynthetic protein FliR
MVVVAPLLGHQVVPVQVKVGISAFLAFIMFPVLAKTAPSISIDLLPFILVVMKEIVIGLVLGFAIGIIFAGARFAGDIIALDTGLSIASVFDPEQGQSNVVINEAMYLMAMMVFLVLNGHHFMLRALQLSYVAAPIGTFVPGPIVSGKLVQLVGFVFVIAVKLAVPVMVSVFLCNIALAVLSRVMPQMNIFQLGFPLKIGLGFVMMVASVPFMVAMFKQLLTGFEDNILELVKAL